MQLNSALPFAPYGANWKLQRRILHTHYNPEAIRAYDHVLHQITRKLVLALHETPAEFIPHLNLASGRVVMATVYGIDVPDAEDPYISHAEKTTSLITEAALPGAFMVDLLPILKVLPTWFPFASFWKVGRMGRDMVDAMITKPLLRVKEEMVRLIFVWGKSEMKPPSKDTGTAPLSLAREALADDKMRAEMGEDKLLESARWVAGSMYGAGGEAVASTILVLILALCQYPEAQRRAQEELDKVIGDGRFIEIGDRPSLPYVNALLLEVLRWRPVLPVGIARCSVKDDVYKGYHIPQGTIVIPNIWAVAMEHCGSCPSNTFAPERFLDSNNDARVLMESFDYSFGFGRRVCPGKAMAENTLFLFAANILSAFTITPLPGQSPPKPEFKNSFVR
ncbi:hypothetical protein ONZ45_g8289 [Pleurotus djamor]|nr:hypothetical protein ONZ45_g8289 [Pleurotus djamor]